LPYPEEENVLDKGGKYRWRVSAKREGKEEVVVESEFFVASNRVLEQVGKVRRLVEGDDPLGWLLAADLYDELGVYGKALPLFEKLAARSPEAASYQVALARYYTLAGREEDAKKARDRAKDLGVDLGNK
jgi:tetratricopeptide (TPR) repeat protein